MLALFHNQSVFTERLERSGLPSAGWLKEVAAGLRKKDPSMSWTTSLDEACKYFGIPSMRSYDRQLDALLRYKKQGPSPKLELGYLFREQGVGPTSVLDADRLKEYDESIFQPKEMRHRSKMLMIVRSAARANEDFSEGLPMNEKELAVVFDRLSDRDRYDVIMTKMLPLRIVRLFLDNLEGYTEFARSLEEDYRDGRESTIVILLGVALYTYCGKALLERRDQLEHRDAYFIIDTPLYGDKEKRLFVWAYLYDRTGEGGSKVENATLYLTAAVKEKGKDYDPCAIMTGHYATMTHDRGVMNGIEFQSEMTRISNRAGLFAYLCNEAISEQEVAGNSYDKGADLSVLSGGFGCLLTHELTVAGKYDRQMILQQIVDVLKSDELSRPVGLVELLKTEDMDVPYFVMPNDRDNGLLGNHEEFMVTCPITTHVYSDRPDMGFDKVDTSCVLGPQPFDIKPVSMSLNGPDAETIRNLSNWLVKTQDVVPSCGPY